VFVGHVGVGLMLKRTERRVSIGVLFLAAMLLDILLWVFVLLGLERVEVPPDFGRRHYLTFVFPYSHSLVGAVVVALIAGGLVALIRTSRNARPSAAALAVILAVMSHFVLDAIVHVPEMTLAGPGTLVFGLGLWNVMPVALSLEVAIAAVGLVLYLRDARLDRVRSAAAIGLVGVVAALTVAGGTLSPPPPSPAAAAVSSLVTIVLVVAAGFWIDAPRPVPSR
jgi:hypothetical protein